MRTMKPLSILVILVLILPTLAVAQDGPVVWLSMVQAREGQSEALTRIIIEHNSALYGALMEQGAVQLWGVAQPIVHRPGMDYSHVEFAVFTNWAGADVFMGTFMASLQAMSEEERQARQEEWQSAVVPGTHYDVINRGVHLGGTPEGRPGYLYLAYLKARPGADVMAYYEEVSVPLFEELSAAGQIGHFGLEVQEIHSDPSWSHVVWYEMPNLAAEDAVHAAMDAAEAARTDEENAALQARVAATIDLDAHWDQIMLVTHWDDGSGASEGDSDGGMGGGGENSGAGGK